MSVLAIRGSKRIVALRVEAEVHYNWLHTSTCSVWESYTSVRRDSLTAFRSSLVLTLGLFASNLVLLRGVLYVH